MVEPSRGWFAQAARDLESARCQAEGGFFEWACSAAQQAAEKALKAVYQKPEAEARGNSVAGRLAGLRERVPVPEDLFDCARLLDRFHIPTWYPNGWPAEELLFWLDRAEAIRRLAEAARRLVRQQPGVRAVYLFGSPAEGRAVPGSDAHILIRNARL